ncbi:Myb DNA-bind 5 domain containing protein [Asbolus verrucosus]|uniref:Regulatory protein zeste n=1 Tax=Asbolus verrucosus TaxID=1661398 RepID=A0A482V9B3_ASBVE|nr:Myb DNA-bind 5 domain containing protein [Asbolus verrucosus]
MFQDKEKRQRAPNFSSDEKSLVLTLIYDKKHIIENKKTDGVTNNEKEQAWIIITDLFNAQSSAGIKRSVESMQKMYYNQKKQVRKEYANDKIYKRRIEGGPSSMKMKKNLHYELTLANMNQKMMVGLDNIYGGDASSESEVEVLIFP